MTARKKTKKNVQGGMTSAAIRQSYLDFFEAHDHTIVPSMSLVPGGDQTLLFTNSGMVQFKDVFLGTGKRPYTRVADSQKCMRVAGKHNDLDDVGRDDTHHTFFEMLGNWSFGDYYKKEAITWAWELLTEVWALPKDKIWATCFEDELGEIDRDDEAASFWRQQPGFNHDHLLFFGRDENFWEMAETGPCGPDSEIFIDRGSEFCDLKATPDHECRVNGDCQRFLELWNLVFIQYNRKSADELTPLPAKHVDTGMGFERLVSVLQDVPSNYQTDLFTPMLDQIQQITGHTDSERKEHVTPYRVIADHARAASFLIADGVVPGNVGRNYVCRMIIRRASRFGSMIGLDDPFLAQIAEVVIREYGNFYQELEKNRSAILQTLSEEETRFQQTIDKGLSHLASLIEMTRDGGQTSIPGVETFNLYATYGLPFEITRDIVRDEGLTVDEDGFFQAMDAHRLASGAGEAIGSLVEDDISLYQDLLNDLQQAGDLGEAGVVYNPYTASPATTAILGFVREGSVTTEVKQGDSVSVVLAETPFYVEAGGQVSDTGELKAAKKDEWVIRVHGTHSPIDGLVLHQGTVEKGTPRVNDRAIAQIDHIRRLDIMRNHTATHLLHAALRETLGDHVRQAGSLVAPDRLRFDFTHSQAMTLDEIDLVEEWVNQAILANYPLNIEHQTREKAIAGGAMALFGETYGDEVRTVQIGNDELISYELCGGTHVHETGLIGHFLIKQEGSVAAGIRRIEALTGQGAHASIRAQRQALQSIASELGTSIDNTPDRVVQLKEDLNELQKTARAGQKDTALVSYQALKPAKVKDILVMVGEIPDSDADTLRELADRFRSENPSSVVVLATVTSGKPLIIAAVTENLIARGMHAGHLVKEVATQVGGGGGGKPSMAQAGGKDSSKLTDALGSVTAWVEDHLQADESHR